MACPACQLSFCEVLDLLSTSSRKAQMESEGQSPDLRRYIGHTRVHTEARTQLECRCGGSTSKTTYSYTQGKCNHGSHLASNTHGPDPYDIEEEVTYKRVEHVRPRPTWNVSALTEELSKAVTNTLLPPTDVLLPCDGADLHNIEPPYGSEPFQVSETKVFNPLDMEGDAFPQCTTLDYSTSCSSEASSSFIRITSVSVSEIEDD